MSETLRLRYVAWMEKHIQRIGADRMGWRNGTPGYAFALRYRRMYGKSHLVTVGTS